jgi:hypothetical protein
MGKINIEERVAFLAEKFDVFKCDIESDFNKKIKKLETQYDVVDIIEADKTNIKTIGLLGLTQYIKTDSNGKELIKYRKHVSVCYDIFVDMLQADPTNNKMYLQWMLNTLTRLIKDERIDSAIQFATEDLPQAREYIELFESNKRKKRFKELCEKSYVLRGVKDVTNINQYKSLSQLFDAIDPFIERDPTEMESLIDRYVRNGEAEVPVKDRKFTLFIPKTVEANVIFELQ